MKKYTLLYIICLTLAFPLAMRAQALSDEQVLQMVQKEHAAGRSQAQIVTRLMQRGVNIQQLRRVRQRYDRLVKKQGLGVVADAAVNDAEQRMRKANGEQSEMAQEITKDTYDFGFLTLPDGYDEEKLETELEKQLTRFLLELGTGFAYLGRQKQIIVAGKTRKLDMLFFHINLNCYIVIELKTCSLPARIRRKAELLRQCRE